MKRVSLFQIFYQMLTISAFTFGGGFVIVTLMRERLVSQRAWLSESEMLDMTALAQSAPGPIAVNTAVLVGWQLAGFPGMLLAVLGCILPPMVILSVISVFYEVFIESVAVSLFLRGMQAGVAAVVLDVSLSLGRTVLAQRSCIHTLLLVAALVLTLFFNVNPLWLLLGAPSIGIITTPRKKASL